ncbi:C6 transcription factor [Pochonia chlamydosporia 170]|uniref:C6 transcription factor n=1 Tax=Pochonia chlamydosporia 170 TaxID=1380566 RepID=A0A179FIR6_METCM|nr:C6 transcription factor [Pochonia chlamydosporia 170]OAQ65466.1 C6 transcription factor [Pochonia chlamydosporia 170]
MSRQAKSCARCRQQKVRCDRVAPRCSRCTSSKTGCSFSEPAPSHQDPASNSPPPPAWTPSDSTTSQDFSFSLPPSPLLWLDENAGNSSHECQIEPESAGANTNGSNIKVKRKRRRACLSCVRCHRLKVKCDKKEPCTRCRLSGWGKQCEYTHRIESNGEALSNAPSPYVLTEEDPQVALATWHSRHRGLSHWRNLLSKLGSIAQVNSMPNLATDEVIRRNHSTACGIMLPDNFPFNSPRAAPFLCIEKVRSLIDSHRGDCDRFINSYMNIYQIVHPIIDEEQFRDRVSAYWDDPSSVDVAWLSQFLMVLALGQLIVTKRTAPTVELCMAAEACLAKTPFMLRPNISTMRTMCLMVLAKLTTNATCWSFDACWNLLGFVVRLAICLGFHRRDPPAHSSSVVYQDWESGKIIWSTLLYFNIQVAMISGMPSCISMDDISSHDVPWDFAPLDTATAAWHSIIHSSCPTIVKIISRVNASTTLPSYEEILEYSTQIRQCMSLLDRAQGPQALRITLDMFFRRVLLVLHRRHALEADAPTKYPVSYWASLECSLALLVHQHDLYDEEQAPEGTDLLFRLYMLDVFAAAVTATIHLLRKDAPLAAGFAIPPRQTILETLQACTDLWANETIQSPCFKIGHALLNRIVEALVEGTASLP